MKAILRVAAATVVLATAAGTAGAVATAADPSPDPVLGATAEATVYASEDRVLDVWNRSTVEARFVVEATGGWTVEPSAVVLAPDERASLAVAGDGEDGSTVRVIVRSVAPPPQGHSESAISLTARIYRERPPDLTQAVWIALAVISAAVVTTAFVRRLRRFASTHSIVRNPSQEDPR